MENYDGPNYDTAKLNDSRKTMPLASCDTYEPVMITLTLPMWTFFTCFILLLLIYYLRKIQYFRLYDKCTPRNAHFQYDFHLTIGKHSSNYNTLDSMIILDLLDSQLVSTMTIQVPGTTIYNKDHVFLYRHSRPNVHCVKFSIYRRLPIRDVKSIRVAHNCSQTDSRIFVYAVDLYDLANNESKFFPITSVVKYRGTQWALQTTFEPRNDASFKRLGTTCYDPFAQSQWPTLLELLTLVVYIWCASFCFGRIISIEDILKNLPLHILTISFLAGSSAAVIGFIHVYFIKLHAVDSHYDNVFLEMAQWLSVTLVVLVSGCFWTLSIEQQNQCWESTKSWIISTVSSSTILSMILFCVHFLLKHRKYKLEGQILCETDAYLSKTNSKTQLEFIGEPAPSISNCCGSNGTGIKRPSETVSKTTKTGMGVTRPGAKLATARPIQNPEAHKQKSKEHAPWKAADSDGKKEEDNLDNAYGRYIKNKNRNSISQYV